MASVQNESRQVRRAKLRRRHFMRLLSTDNPHALGVPVRKERRKLARAYAAGAWRTERQAQGLGAINHG